MNGEVKKTVSVISGLLILLCAAGIIFGGFQKSISQTLIGVMLFIAVSIITRGKLWIIVWVGIIGYVVYRLIASGVF